MIKTIADVLKNKGNFIVSIRPEASVYNALELMATEDIGSVLVLEGGQVVGIISEREYARKVILEGRSSLETTVQDVMDSKVFCVSPDLKIEEGLELMTNKRCRHLPVLENDSLVGVVSIGDLVHAVMRNHEFKIDQLEGYITQ